MNALTENELQKIDGGFAPLNVYYLPALAVWTPQDTIWLEEMLSHYAL